jgi:hypothetical protein
LNGQLLSDGNGQATVLSPYIPGAQADYAVEARVQVVRVHPAGCSNFGIFVRATADNQGGYRAVADCLGVDTPFSGQIKINSDTTLAQSDYTPNTDWHVYRIEVQGNYIRLLIDGSAVLEAVSNRYLSGGRIGLSMDSTEVIVDKVAHIQSHHHSLHPHGALHQCRGRWSRHVVDALQLLVCHQQR